MRASRKSDEGFTLIELLVATAVFLIIGGTAVRLCTSNVSLFNAQQNQSMLNFSLRNAAAQIQIDAAQAGNGFYQGADIAAWPIGVTVVPAANPSSCFNAISHTYGSGCFDTLNVISTDTSAPPASPSDCAGGPAMTYSATICLTPVAPTTVSQLISKYKKDDRILLVTVDGLYMTSVQLTSNGTPTPDGSMAQYTHVLTNSDGTNTSTNDPLLISTSADKGVCPGSTCKITYSFPSTSWVMRLAPITFSVDASDSTNPKLMRGNILSGSNDIIAEQVIGFKVGVSYINSSTDSYTYNTSDYGGDYTRIRAVRVTIIGRTQPAVGQNTFSNSFDGGRYRIESVSVVVNPRNLSMND